MKRYIQAATNLKQGSYVVDRNGKIYDIGMHVPSTTFQERGILHLSLTDADFLLNQGLISEDEATAVILYNFVEWLEDEKDFYDKNAVIPLTALSEFSQWAETKWARNAQKIFFNQNLRTMKEIEAKLATLPEFNSINNQWYNYLKQNFCKISRYGNVVEFRIGSDDFNWNSVIIDKVILKFDSGRPYSTRYNIVRENDKGYKMIMKDASLEDILNNDKVVMASEGDNKMKKRFVASSKKITCAEEKTLEEWCKDLPEKIHTLYLHWTDGTIIGKASIKDAIDFYGDASVSSSYSDGDGQISVWIY